MIHTFKALGCCIAMDVDSGAVHVLDELSYDLLNCVTPPMAEHCPEDVIEKLSQYPRAELEECWQELKELAGILQTLAGLEKELGGGTAAQTVQVLMGEEVRALSE